jgi:C-terminal processing protease CtpA/Prc
MTRTAIAAMFLLAMPAMSAERPGWFGMSVSYHVDGQSRWLRLCAVAPNGPAARAGLKEGDLLTHVNGKRIAFPNVRTALEHLATHRAGHRVRLRVARGTRTFDVTIVPRQNPRSPTSTSAASPSP